MFWRIIHIYFQIDCNNTAKKKRKEKKKKASKKGVSREKNKHSLYPHEPFINHHILPRISTVKKKKRKREKKTAEKRKEDVCDILFMEHYRNKYNW